MKKKIFLATLSCLLLFSGVVSAASLWGTYKGNQIIRLTVNGDPVKVTDVPAISYNGRTMIPINLLKQAGINYSWDQINQTVNISSVNNQSSNNTSTIKQQIIIADNFQNLSNLGEMISGLSNGYSLAYNGIKLSNDPKSLFSQMNSRLNEVINTYNKYNNLLGSDSRYTTVLSGYRESLEYYKIVDDALYNYYLQGKQEDFDKYLKYTGLGFDKSATSRYTASNQYMFYINLAKNS